MMAVPSNSNAATHAAAAAAAASKAVVETFLVFELLVLLRKGEGMGEAVGLSEAVEFSRISVASLFGNLRLVPRNDNRPASHGQLQLLRFFWW